MKLNALPLRICYVCADLGIPVAGTKGASAHVRGLVRAFTELGHDVRIVSPRCEGADRLRLPVAPVPTSSLADELAEGVPNNVRRALAHVWNNVEVERALSRTLERWRPHLVYERYSPFAVAGGLVARRFDVPHVLEVNSPLAWEGRTYRKQALTDAAEGLEYAAFRQASLVVAVSRELADLLVDLGVEPERIAVVPNGVDMSLFPPAAAPAPASSDRFVIGFVGSLKPWHGLEVLGRAFELLSADPRYRLLIVGDGPERKRVRALAEAYPGRVTHTAAVPHREVPRHLRAMDVAVAPYPVLENFYFSPLKVLEYMAAGRPVVASRIGQVDALLEHGRTGMLVEPGDAGELARTIAHLAADEPLRMALGAAAAAEAHARHGWTERAREILSRYRTAVPASAEGTAASVPYRAPVGRVGA